MVFSLCIRLHQVSYRYSRLFCRLHRPRVLHRLRCQLPSCIIAIVLLFHNCRDRYCEASVTQHLHKCDREGHNCLDWAADSGSVNLIEYLIRRGMNVFQLDNLNRGPLYWAIKSMSKCAALLLEITQLLQRFTIGNRVDAAKFLIKCGCDSSVPDNNGRRNPVTM